MCGCDECVVIDLYDQWCVGVYGLYEQVDDEYCGFGIQCVGQKVCVQCGEIGQWCYVGVCLCVVGFCYEYFCVEVDQVYCVDQFDGVEELQ